MEQAKELVAKVINDSPNSMNTQLGASVVAGFTAAFFSLPFDMIKSRLQNKNQYKGLADVFTSILRKVRVFLHCLPRA